jgi:predicted anti-sigma-YlaC factor YlaD
MAGSDYACDVARARASLKLDGELSEFDRRLLERHLDRCVDCRDFVERTARFTALMRDDPLVPFVCGRVVPQSLVHSAVRRVVPAVASVLLVGIAATTLATRESGGSRVSPDSSYATFLAPPAVAEQLAAAQSSGARVKLPIGQRSVLAEFQPAQHAPRATRHIPS